MKITKVCGLCARACASVQLCLATTLLIAVSGCSTSARIPYQQSLYKFTYNYLRTAECLNEQDLQSAYEDCGRSYSQDYRAYQQIRDTYVQQQLGDKVPSQSE